MARPTLFGHRKFRALTRQLKSKAVAVGSLELLWAVANDSGDALLGSPEDVEDIADWRGKRGQLATALVACGFLDETPDGLVVHDHAHHCPQYVRRRRDREHARRAPDASVTSHRRVTDASMASTPNSHHPSPITQRGGGTPPALMGQHNEHRNHAVCGVICVPSGTWRDMVEASQGDEAAVTAYVHRVWDTLGDGPRPLDRFKFWREQWDLDHPRPKPAPTESDWVPPDHPSRRKVVSA